MAQTSGSPAGFNTNQLEEELARRKRTHPDTTGITAPRPHKRSRNEPIYKSKERSLADPATTRVDSSPADIDDAEVPDEQTLLESIDWDEFVKRNPISYLDDARPTASWDSSVTFGREDAVGGGEGDDSSRLDDVRSTTSWRSDGSEFNGFGEDETGFDGFGDEDTGFNGFGDDDTSEIHDPITAEEVELVDLTETQEQRAVRGTQNTFIQAKLYWASRVQPMTFRATATKIPEEDLEEKGLKLKKEWKKSDVVRDKKAYDQGIGDGKEMNLQQKRIEETPTWLSEDTG